MRARTQSSKSSSGGAIRDVSVNIVELRGETRKKKTQRIGAIIAHKYHSNAFRKYARSDGAERDDAGEYAHECDENPVPCVVLLRASL